MIQALAKLYELALGMGIGYVVQETLLLFRRWSDFVHMERYALWVLVFDIFLFLLLRFVHNSY